MKTYICLVRGINVGGKHLLPMKELRTLFEDLGLQNVRTYIQSGNVVFQSAEERGMRLSDAISAAMLDRFGFKPQVLLLSSGAFEAAMGANPFPEAEAEPNSLHLYFLASSPVQPDLAVLEELRKDGERFGWLIVSFICMLRKGLAVRSWPPMSKNRLAYRSAPAIGAVSAGSWPWRKKYLRRALCWIGSLGSYQ